MTEGTSEHGQGREGGISIRIASWLAWAVCALSLALSALTFLLIALNLSLNAPIYFYWFESTIIAVGYPVIGAIIASRLPAHPIGWICCAIGLLAAVQHFSGEYAIYAIRAPHPEALPGVRRCSGSVSRPGYSSSASSSSCSFCSPTVGCRASAGDLLHGSVPLSL